MPQISICRTISSSPVGLCSSWCVFPDHAKEKGTPNSITPCETGHWSLLQSPCTKRQYVHGLASWLSWHQSLLDLMHCNQKDGPDPGRAQSRDRSFFPQTLHTQSGHPAPSPVPRAEAHCNPILQSRERESQKIQVFAQIQTAGAAYCQTVMAKHIAGVSYRGKTFSRERSPAEILEAKGSPTPA